MQPASKIDWNDSVLVQESLLSMAAFLKDNPEMSSRLSLTIDQAFMGLNGNPPSQADCEAFLKQLATAHYPDGRRGS